MTLTIETLAEAIEAAHVGYSIRLTKLVDGEAEYTATVDGQEPRIFPDHPDASEYVETFRRTARARAVLTAIEQAGYVVVPRDLTDEMRGAVVHLDCTSRLDPTWPEYWSAMLAAAPKIQHSEGE